MLRQINSSAIDAMLNYIQSGTTRLTICKELPTTYAEAITTYRIGEKNSPVITGPSNQAGGGRYIEINAVTDGEVKADGMATYLALVDTANSRLLAVVDLDEAKDFTGESTFTVTAHKIIVSVAS